jgi:tetratricopeptide (TPR) repeat protein
MKTLRTHTTRALVTSLMLGLGSGAQAQGSGDATALAAEGRALIRSGQLKQAEDTLRKAVKASGNSIEALYDLARVKFAAGELKPAQAACKALSQKDERAVLSHVCQARAFLLWRRASRAQEFLDQARAIDASHPEVLLAFADMKRVAGESSASEEAYKQLLGLDPSNADAHYGLGELYLVTPDLPAAKQSFTEALKHAPGWIDALYQLGRLEQGKTSVELLEKVVAARPDWPDARLALALAKQQGGDLDGAEALLRAVITKSSDSAVAHARLGGLLAAKRDWASAEPELRLGLAGLPNDPEANLALARVLAATDRVDDAFAQYRVVSGLERQSARALIEAGDLALSMSRVALAAAFVEKALEREPKSERALALKRKLDTTK